MRRPYLIILIIFFCTSLHAQQHYLKANDRRIEEASGKEILLRGMGLGGWMLQEPYMLQLIGVAKAQYDIRQKIASLIGNDHTQQFYDAWLNNHCTKADIDSLAAWGFNSVRLPLHYNLFTLPVDKEPVAGKNTWLSKGFQLTDSLLSWCQSNHIYLILDLHAAPGGQGNDVAISDRDTSTPSLWQSEANRKKTIELWKQLVTRYAKKEWIGGYDLINEPNWGFDDPTDNNGAKEKRNIPLKKLLQDITTVIRKIDKKHAIFIEGNCWANNYNGIFPLWDKNMIVSFHKYWNNNDDGSIKTFLEYREKYNVPLWLGETGENSNAWFTDAVRLFERNNVGWCMWPLKKAGYNNPLQVKLSEGYKAILAYWKGEGPRPDADYAFRSLMELAVNSNTRNNIVHHDVTDAMIRQVQNSAVAPYHDNLLKPGTVIYAADYDMGRSGIAYHDKDSADYWSLTQVRTPGNTGGQYRNDGVDIESSKDDISNGYSVGWIQDGEWLQYSLYAAEEGIYDVHVRTASRYTEGKIQLILNNEPAGAALTVPVSGGWYQWQTSTIRNIRFSKGWNTLRVLAAKGGYNLNYLQFEKNGTTASITK
jgi:aryl-phospho-beta-D-glucosidase BglC (GH1 family)